MVYLKSTGLATLVSLITLPHLAFSAPALRRQEDPQTSFTLDPSQIAPGLANDGQGENVDPGQVRSLTSTNMFINFCVGQNVPLTNGQQIDGGSCNTAPIGVVVGKNKQPVAMLISPPNFSENVEENQNIVVQMRLRNFNAGSAVNSQTNYLAAPQTADANGIMFGNVKIIVQQIQDLKLTEPINPAEFTFFKTINNGAEGDLLTTDIPGGLPAGIYRLCTNLVSANGNMAISSHAQRGSVDDCNYFTVVPVGQGNNGGDGDAGVIEDGNNNDNGNNDNGNNDNGNNNNENNNNNNNNEGNNGANDTPAQVAAKEAQRLNASFVNLSAGSDCDGTNFCTGDGQFAQCVAGKIVVLGCAPTTTCLATPRAPGSDQVDITCAFQDQVIAAIEAAGVTGGLRG